MDNRVRAYCIYCSLDILHTENLKLVQINCHPNICKSNSRPRKMLKFEFKNVYVHLKVYDIEQTQLVLLTSRYLAYFEFFDRIYLFTVIWKEATHGKTINAILFIASQ